MDHGGRVPANHLIGVPAPNAPITVRKCVAPYRRTLTGASGAAVLSSVLELARPWPLTLAVDHAIDRAGGSAGGWFDSLPPQQVVWIAALLTITLAAVGAAVDYSAVVLSESAAERVGADLREAAFAKVADLSAEFHDRQRSGDLVARLTSDVGRILDAIVAAFTTLLPDAVLVLGILIVLTAIDPTLALVALAVVPVLGWLASAQRRRVRAAQYAARTQNGRLSNTATDLLRNIRILQAFQRQDLATERFGRRNAALLRSELDAVVVEARWSPRAELLLAFGSGLVLVIGGTRALSGDLTVGTLLVVVSYVTSLYRPVRSLARLSTTFAKASASQVRLAEILNSRDQLPVDPAALEAPAISRSVRFRGACFSYRPGQPVVNALDLVVRSGETVCIVGPSGTGKSTLLSLLLRLYDVDAGAIEIDASTSAGAIWRASGDGSPWFPRTPGCSTGPSPTTSGSAWLEPAGRRSWLQEEQPWSMSSLWLCPTDSTRRSARAATGSQEVSVSGSPSPEPCSHRLRCCSWMNRRVPSMLTLRPPSWPPSTVRQIRAPSSPSLTTSGWLTSPTG